MLKEEGFRGRGFVRRLLMVLGSGSLSLFLLPGAQAAPHLPLERGSIHLVSYRIEGNQVILSSADGRLFSLPAGTPGVDALLETIDQNPGQEVPAGILTVQDIIDLLRAGISEETIAVYIEESGARYVLSKEDLLAIKKAGGSESFLQFLIRGRLRRVPSAGVRGGVPPEEAVPVEPPAVAEPEPSGIPIYPYVYPGYPTFFGFPFISTVVIPPLFNHRKFPGNFPPDGLPEPGAETRSLVGSRPSPVTGGAGTGTRLRWRGAGGITRRVGPSPSALPLRFDSASPVGLSSPRLVSPRPSLSPPAASAPRRSMSRGGGAGRSGSRGAVSTPARARGTRSLTRKH